MSELSDIKHAVEVTNKAITELMMAVTGNERLGIRGIIGELKAIKAFNEKEISELKKITSKHEKIYNKILGMSIVGGFLLSFVFEAGKFVFDYYKK